METLLYYWDIVWLNYMQWLLAGKTNYVGSPYRCVGWTTLAKAMDVHVDHQAHFVVSFSQPALLGGIAKPQSTKVISVKLSSGSRRAGSRNPAMCLEIVSLSYLALGM